MLILDKVYKSYAKEKRKKLLAIPTLCLCLFTSCPIPNSLGFMPALQRNGPEVMAKGKTLEGLLGNGNICAPTFVCLIKAVNIFSRTLEGAGERAGGFGKAGPREEEQVSPGPSRPSVNREEAAPQPRLWLRVDRCPLVFPQEKQSP